MSLGINVTDASRGDRALARAGGGRGLAPVVQSRVLDLAACRREISALGHENDGLRRENEKLKVQISARGATLTVPPKGLLAGPLSLRSREADGDTVRCSLCGLIFLPAALRHDQALRSGVDVAFAVRAVAGVLSPQRSDVEPRKVQAMHAQSSVPAHDGMTSAVTTGEQLRPRVLGAGRPQTAHEVADPAGLRARCARDGVAAVVFVELVFVAMLAVAVPHGRGAVAGAIVAGFLLLSWSRGFSSATYAPPAMGSRCSRRVGPMASGRRSLLADTASKAALPPRTFGAPKLARRMRRRLPATAARPCVAC